MPGSALIGSLRVALGLDSAEFNSGAKQAQSTLSGLTNSIKGFAAGAIGALSFGAVTSVLKSSVDHMDEIWKSSQKIGIPVEQLSKLEYAGKLADISLGDLQENVKKLSVQLVELAGGGSNKAGAALKAMGISIYDVNGKLRPTTEIIADVAGSFSKYSDGAQKSALATALFSKSGIQMIPLLNAGADGLREAYTEADRFGVVVTKEAAVAAERFNDNLTRVKEASVGLVNQIVTNLIPTFADISDQFVSNLGSSKELAAVIAGPLKQAIADIISVGLEGAQTLRALGLIATTLSSNFNDPQGFDVAMQRWHTTFEQIKTDASETEIRISKMHNAIADPTGSLSSIDKLIAKSKEINTPTDTENAPIVQVTKKTKHHATEAEKALKRMKEEGKRVFEDTRSPIESYMLDVAHLNELLKVGAIDHDTYTRAVKKLRDEFSSTGEEVKSAAAEIGDAFSSAISSGIDQLLDGTFKLKDAVSDLLKSLTKLALNNAFQLLGSGGGLYGGGILSGIGKLFGFAKGGTIMPGGHGGIDSQLVMFRKSPNERVDITKPGQTLHSGGGGGFTLIDQRSNAPKAEVQEDNQGNYTVVIRDEVKRTINQGYADDALGSRFSQRPTRVRR